MFREKHASAMRAAGELLGSDEPFPDTPFDEILETLADAEGGSGALLPGYWQQPPGEDGHGNDTSPLRSFVKECSGISEGLDVAMLCLRRRLDGGKGGKTTKRPPKKRIMKAIVGRLLGKLGHIPAASNSVDAEEGSDGGAEGGSDAPPASRFAALVAGLAAKGREAAADAAAEDEDDATPGLAAAAAASDERPVISSVRPLPKRATRGAARQRWGGDSGEEGGDADKSDSGMSDALSQSEHEHGDSEQEEAEDAGPAFLPGLQAAVAMSQELQATQSALDEAGGLPPTAGGAARARGLERDLAESTGSLRRALVEAGLLLPPPNSAPTEGGLQGGVGTPGIMGPSSDPGDALPPATSPVGPAWANAGAQWEARGRTTPPQTAPAEMTEAEAAAAAEEAAEDAPEPPLAAPWTELQQRALGDDPDSALPFIGDPQDGKEVPPATLQAAAAPAAPITSLRPPWNPNTTFLPLTEATAVAQGVKEDTPPDAVQQPPPSSQPTSDGDADGTAGSHDARAAPEPKDAADNAARGDSDKHHGTVPDVPDTTVPPAARAMAGPGGSMPYSAFMSKQAPPPPRYNLAPSRFLPAAPLVADLVYRPRAEVSTVRDSQGSAAGVAFPPWAAAKLAVGADSPPYSKFNFKDPNTEEALDKMTQGGRRGLLLARPDGSLEAVQQPPGFMHVPQAPEPTSPWQRQPAPPQQADGVQGGYSYAPSSSPPAAEQQTQLQQLFEQFMAYQEHRQGRHVQPPQLEPGHGQGDLSFNSMGTGGVPCCSPLSPRRSGKLKGAQEHQVRPWPRGDPPCTPLRTSATPL